MATAMKTQGKHKNGKKARRLGGHQQQGQATTGRSRG